MASEPITGMGSDWVAVPRNTALVITREKNGFMSVMRSPLSVGPAPERLRLRQEEVSRSLEAVCSASEVTSRAWLVSRKRHRDGEYGPGHPARVCCCCDGYRIRT